MTATVLGRISWSLQQDEEGVRSYTLLTRVITDNVLDGPQTVLNASGLPQLGDPWTFGNDNDLWCTCRPTVAVRLDQHKEGDPHKAWVVENTFNNKPLKRCSDSKFDDPLLEPDRISGGFAKYTEESSLDKDGNRIMSSSFEIFTGPLVEWDANRPSVTIEQNRADLELSLLSELMDSVNDAPLWGMSARTIKLSNASWEQKWYGTCSTYYTRKLEFDINFNTFDRDIPDQGSKTVKGTWDSSDPPVWSPDAGVDPDNPLHFERYTDAKGNPMRTLLDGNGHPLGYGHVGPGAPVAPGIAFQKYPSKNLLLLGIPTTLG